MASSHLLMQASLLLTKIDAYLDKKPAQFKDTFVLQQSEHTLYSVPFRVDMPSGRALTHLDYVCASCAQQVAEHTNNDIIAEALDRNTDTASCAGCDAPLNFMAGASWMGDVVVDNRQGHPPAATPETLSRLRGNIVREIDNLPYDTDAKFWLEDLMEMTQTLFELPTPHPSS